MSTRLAGNLRYFPLIDIMRFLIALESTGSIYIQTGKKVGMAFLDKGKIVHASYKNLFEGEKAFLRLFTVNEGTFVLKKETISERTISRDTEELLDEAAVKLLVWKEMREIVPTEDICFKIMPVPLEFNQTKVLMSRDQLLILTRLDGTRNVSDISHELGIDTLDVSEILTDLYKQDFVQALDIFETREIEKPDKHIEGPVFSGNLKHFSLLSLVDLFFYKKITGRLKLSRGIYQGEIHFEDGEIIHATNRIWEGEMGLVDLFSWVKGRFSFHASLTDIERTVFLPVEDIVTTSGENLSRWRKIQNVITTPESVFSPSITEQEDEDENLTFTRRQWKILYNIDGKTSIRTIAENLEYSNPSVAEAIYLLYKEGAVKPVNLSELSSLLDEVCEEIISEKEEEETFQGKKEEVRESKGESSKEVGEVEPSEEIQMKYNKVKEEVDDLISIMDSSAQSALDDMESSGFLDR